jgi:hypothetical protein
MAKTILALFDKKSEAKEAVRALEELGFTENDVSMFASGEDASLSEHGIPGEHAELWNEGVKRGGILVMVHAEEIQAEPVASLLTDKGAVDIEERASAWTSGKWRSQYGKKRAKETTAEEVPVSPSTPSVVGAGIGHAGESTAGGIDIGGPSDTVSDVRARFRRAHIYDVGHRPVREPELAGRAGGRGEKNR